MHYHPEQQHIQKVNSEMPNTQNQHTLSYTD